MSEDSRVNQKLSELFNDPEWLESIKQDTLIDEIFFLPKDSFPNEVIATSTFTLDDTTITIGVEPIGPIL